MVAGCDAPEEVEEPKCLHDHTHEGPFEEHEQDTSQETYSATQLLLARKEIERLLWSDDEGQARQEQELRNRR